MSTKAIAQSTIWQLLSQAAMAVLSILAAKFVAVGLSKELAGYYNSAYGFLQIFAIIADFGLYAVSVREVSKVQGEERQKVFGVLLLLRTIILCISMGACIAIVWVMPAWRGTPFPIGVTIASLVPFFTLLAGTIRTIFQVEYKLQYVFIAEVTQRIITTVGLGLFIVAGVRLTTDVHVYEWFLWIGGIGAFVLLALSFLFASKFMRVRYHYDAALMKKMALLAAPYGIAYLLMAFYRQLDVAFIALLRPDFALENAYYGFAGRVEDMAFLIPTFLLNSILPILSARIAANQPVDQLLKKTLFILLVVGTTFFAFSFFWAKPFTLMFATPAYLSTATHGGSDTAFMLMSIPMLFNGLILMAFYVFLAKHQWKRLITSFGIGVTFTIILNLIFTPKYGFIGAGGTLIAVHLLLTLILLPQLMQSLKLRLGLTEFLQWITFTAILIPLLYETAPYLTSAMLTLIAGTISIPLLGLLAFALGMHKTLQWKAA
jgi:O-antigen/teichoic acid export membrane protein